MDAYLGPAGNLVAFKCPSDEQISLADSVSLSRTLAGVQKAQYGRRAPRAWQVGIGTATPEEVGQLMGLLQGLYGPPPWTYVGPWAQVTNLLTPAASICSPGSWVGAGTASGSVTLDNGQRPGQSIISDTNGAIIFPSVPVAAGVRVTGSAWAAGEQSYSVQVVFRDAGGVQLSFVAATVQAPAGFPLVRGSVTGMPPEGAAFAELRVANGRRVAQPSITWTDDVAPWSVGGGAPKVVHRGLSEAVQLAVRDQAFLRRSSASFVLEEVGNA